MAEPFCQTEPPTEDARSFVRAVKAGEADTVATLLDNADLRAQVDAPWFDFDAPAIVFAAGSRTSTRAMLEVLLAAGASPTARSEWWAGGFGVLDHDDHEQAAWLVEQGAPVDAHAAARHDWRDRLAVILGADSAAANAPGGDGQRPLHVAASPAVVDRLLDHGADLEIRDVDHIATPVQYALGGRLDVCRHLLDRGAVPDIHLACALGDEDLASRVLAAEPEALASRVGHCRHTSSERKHGGHMYQWNLRGITVPLLIARDFEHASLYQALAPRAPAVDRLLAACWFGEADAARAIVRSQPDVLDSLPETDRDVLVRAAWDGRVDAARTLLDVGFDPHVQNGEGLTPLHAAAFHGFAEVIRVLLTADPDPPLEVKNQYNGTVLGTLRYGAVHGWRHDGDYGLAAELVLEAGAAISPDLPPTGHEGVDAALARAAGSQ